ncbi:MAG TPA: serine/threonine-protein phosphatase [Phycisphaerales bacterium]|nr:serine/threonine-protein phosphatase [Phycisphaerales bacterium]
MDDKRIGFFIADAIGHGVPAALLTMIISRSLPMRGGCSEGRLISPSDALARLNDDLCDVSDGTPRFATAVYGILDFETGFVQIANAGHPAPLVIGRDQTTEIHAGGPLLGVFHDAQFEEQTVELRPGDTLLLYSDGFEMAFPDTKKPDGSKGDPNQYLAHLTPIGRWMEQDGQSLAQVFEKLEQKLDQADGSMHQADDLTALAISRQPVTASKAA